MFFNLYQHVTCLWSRWTCSARTCRLVAPLAFLRKCHLNATNAWRWGAADRVQGASRVGGLAWTIEYIWSYPYGMGYSTFFKHQIFRRDLLNLLWEWLNVISLQQHLMGVTRNPNLEPWICSQLGKRGDVTWQVTTDRMVSWWVHHFQWDLFTTFG